MTNKLSGRWKFYAAALVFLFVYMMVRGAWLHFFPSEPPKPHSASQGASEVIKSAAEVSNGSVEQESSQDPMQHAKRIVHVPDTRKEVSVDPNEGQSLTQAELNTIHGEKLFDQAMQGDFLSAHELRRMLFRCERFPLNRTSLEVEIQRANDYLAYQASHGKPIPSDGLVGVESMPGLVVFGTNEKNRKHLTEQYHECSKMRKFFSEDLRQQLDKLAESGNVMARYLYALWVPPLDHNLQMFETNLEWTSKAYDYSYANLVDGEPAGLMAFGASYSSGLFTRQDNRLGAALKRAGLKCAYEMPELEDALMRAGIAVFIEPLHTAEQLARHQLFASFEENLTAYCRQE